MNGINGNVFEVKEIVSPFTFKIDPTGWTGEYVRNGYIEEEKKKILMKFKSLEEVLTQPLPDMIDCDMDFENLDRM